MNISGAMNVVSDYVRAQKYALASIRRPADIHLLWGPVYARTKHGLGARFFSLYCLAEAPRDTWSNYLANQPLKDRYARFTSKEARVLADDKIAFYEHCRQHGVATANILALVTARAKPADSTVPHLYSAQELAAAMPPGQYFFKPSNGSHGQGTFSLTVGEHELQWSGRRGSFEDFFEYCKEALAHTESLIVQPKLVNHAQIRQLTQAKGLSTIRVVTFRTEQGISVVAGCLRIVVGDSEIDNFSHGASGNLVAGVDVETGRLVTGRGSRSRVWPSMADVTKHPVSGMAIVGVQLPYWKEVLALVKQAHVSITGLRTVGWDVAILEDGPVVVEANWRYDIDICQVAYKRGFKSIIDAHLPANT